MSSRRLDQSEYFVQLGICYSRWGGPGASSTPIVGAHSVVGRSSLIEAFTLSILHNLRSRWLLTWKS